MADLSREEFQGWMAVLQQDIRSIQPRIDVVSEKVSDLEQDVAVLKDRAQGGAGMAAISGGGTAGIIIGIIEGLRWYFAR